MRQQAEHSVTAAQAQVALREADVTAALALVGQRESELDAAQRRLTRSSTLSSEGAASIQELDDDRRAYGAPRRPRGQQRHRPPLPAPRSKPPGRSLSARSPACPPLRPVSAASKPTSATANCGLRATDGFRCVSRNPARCWDRADVSESYRSVGRTSPSSCPKPWPAALRWVRRFASFWMPRPSM